MVESRKSNNKKGVFVGILLVCYTIFKFYEVIHFAHVEHTKLFNGDSGGNGR